MNLRSLPPLPLAAKNSRTWSIFRPSRLHVTITLFFFLSLNPLMANSFVEEAAYHETIKSLTAIPGLTRKDLESSKRWIQTLSYTQLRFLRAFSRLPDITAQDLHSLATDLNNSRLRFETVLLFDHVLGSPKATVPLGRQLVKLLNDIPFAASRALSSMHHITGVDAPLLLPIIEKVRGLDDAGAWAASALFEQLNTDYEIIRKGVEMITAMSPYQQWAAEQFLRLRDLTAPTLLYGLTAIAKLSPSNGWNVRALMVESPNLSADAALAWLDDFFRFETERQDRWYGDLSATERKLLLKSYARASVELAREINSLHSVTDVFSREIGVDHLQRYSYSELKNLFDSLHPRARAKWSDKMYTALQEKKKNRAVELLTHATEQARWETAGDLTSANIYLLLAHGERLYTSSFRTILVPLLLKRLDSYLGSNILTLITRVDPDNNYSSRFITSLAWKGSLTEFLPKDRVQQKRLLDLVAASAFKSEQSLLLFATTFTRLLKPLYPEARSHLVGLMLDQIDEGNKIVSLLLQTVLQFYQQTHEDLLSKDDTKAITRMQEQRGSIDFSPYYKTPFREWISDQSLSSLSIFHHDDDGRISFLSNCQTLLNNGYTPELAPHLVSAQLPGEVATALTELFQKSFRDSTSTVTELFHLATKHPIVVDWKKTINNINITHTLTVYRSKEYQQELLLLFLNKGYEMFAQRGHSYWRRHQLLSPLHSLLETGMISESLLQEKHRFLSLGSCGGIEAYLELGRVFRNRVDIFATVGMGASHINNQYNRKFLEVIAENPNILSWREIDKLMDAIFQSAEGRDYLQPGSLTALLYKILYQAEQTPWH